MGLTVIVEGYGYGSTDHGAMSKKLYLTMGMPRVGLFRDFNIIPISMGA